MLYNLLVKGVFKMFENKMIVFVWGMIIITIFFIIVFAIGLLVLLIILIKLALKKLRSM